MKILIDMNLPPSWIEVLIQHGYEAKHWKNIGNEKAEDEEILEWARSNDYIIFTHDLDFSAILAHTRLDSPSVIQVRTQHILPEHLQNLVISALQKFSLQLESGSLITIDEHSAKARILPLK